MKNKGRNRSGKRACKVNSPEDGKLFWLENEDASEMPTNINQLNFEHVEIAKKYIDEIVNSVLESMGIKPRREFERIIFEPEIEAENIEGILIPIYSPKTQN